MLKNYFKIAIAVLKRRKFFTFISLFGISFTLTILIVLSALFDYVFSPHYPELNRDRSLYIEEIVKKSNDESGGYSNNAPTFYFFNKYASQLKTPVCIAFASQYVSNTAILNSKKIEIDVKYTNADFWKVMKFDFLEGRPYNKIMVDYGEKIAVITQHIKDQYFGNVPSAVGKYIECDHIQYKVIGVVKNVPYTMIYTYANMYLPYTVTDAYKDDSLIMTPQSTYEGILLANTKNDLDKISEEYQTMFSKIPIEDPKKPIVISHADPYLVTITRNLFGNEMDSGVRKFYTYLFIILLIFTLLPIVNLVNINISRILERSSEIGIRKAFGASSYNLILQFLVENIILTFIGGMLSILFSLITLIVINQSQLIPYAEFVLHKNLICFSLLAFFLFGVLSGVYPAWKMSRMNVVKALKS